MLVRRLRTPPRSQERDCVGFPHSRVGGIEFQSSFEGLEGFRPLSALPVAHVAKIPEVMSAECLSQCSPLMRGQREIAIEPFQSCDAFCPDASKPLAIRAGA